MNSRPCDYCGDPLTGLRADAKVHPGCKTPMRRAPEERRSKAFWTAIWQMRRPVLPVARRRRDRGVDEDDGDGV